MARPRVFVSSTFYDLKHIRSSLDIFIESLGYDSILSEKGDIAYAHDVALDESCYREVGTADIFVLIVGGRYGSAASRESRQPPESFFERYESVTKLEHDEALKRDIPIFILVESPVYAEYQTYLRNKDTSSIVYAHVDSVNVFILLEEILNRRRNNPIHTFDRFSDIESWLREQWAGLFREYLHRTSSQQQIAALTDQVSALREVSSTMKRYLEAVVAKVSPDNSNELIGREEARLNELKQIKALKDNDWVEYALQKSDSFGGVKLTVENVRDLIQKSTSFSNFGKAVAKITGNESLGSKLTSTLEASDRARADFNAARALIGEASIQLTLSEDDLATDGKSKRKGTKRRKRGATDDTEDTK